MDNLTNKQREIIADNLNAFVANFGEPRIERQKPFPGFYVYWPVDSESYVQYAYNIDYLNGWLYGAVQAANKVVERNERK
jgi:hypothetical protein